MTPAAALWSVAPDQAHAAGAPASYCRRNGPTTEGATARAFVPGVHARHGRQERFDQPECLDKVVPDTPSWALTAACPSGQFLNIIGTEKFENDWFCEAKHTCAAGMEQARLNEDGDLWNTGDTPVTEMDDTWCRPECKAGEKCVITKPWQPRSPLAVPRHVYRMLCRRQPEGHPWGWCGYCARNQAAHAGVKLPPSETGRPCACLSFIGTRAGPRRSPPSWIHAASTTSALIASPSTHTHTHTHTHTRARARSHTHTRKHIAATAATITNQGHAKMTLPLLDRGYGHVIRICQLTGGDAVPCVFPHSKMPTGRVPDRRGPPIGCVRRLPQCQVHAGRGHHPRFGLRRAEREDLSHHTPPLVRGPFTTLSWRRCPAAALCTASAPACTTRTLVHRHRFCVRAAAAGRKLIPAAAPRALPHGGAHRAGSFANHPAVSPNRTIRVCRWQRLTQKL